jgi:hypothetical protein
MIDNLLGFQLENQVKEASAKSQGLDDRLN